MYTKEQRTLQPGAHFVACHLFESSVLSIKVAPIRPGVLQVLHDKQRPTSFRSMCVTLFASIN